MSEKQMIHGRTINLFEEEHGKPEKRQECRDRVIELLGHALATDTTNEKLALLRDIGRIVKAHEIYADIVTSDEEHGYRPSAEQVRTAEQKLNKVLQPNEERGSSVSPGHP